jgi:DNA-binding MarR family transcriptional regulator
MEKGDLINEIIEHQDIINRIWRQYEPEAWMGLNLTIAQVKSLFFIANQGQVNFRKLAAALNVTPSNVTGIIDRLVEQDLVSRTENPQDRRMLILRLTDKGNTLVNNLRVRSTTQMSLILNEMSAADLTLILRGVSRLSGAVANYLEANDS